jgi:regulatory protein
VATGPDADPESVARTILLDQLTGRARSRAELRAKLDGRVVPPEIAERLLDRFTEVGLVDDAAFARAWVESRQAGKGLAPRALAQELRRKGIPDEVAKEALETVDEEAQREAAQRLVRRKLRSLRSVDTTTATRRLVGMLGRKGYSSGLAFAVVRDVLAERDDAAELSGYDFSE